MESRMEAPVFSARRTVEETATDISPPPPTLMTAPAFSAKPAEPPAFREADPAAAFEQPPVAPEVTAPTSEPTQFTASAAPPPTHPPSQPAFAPPPPPPAPRAPPTATPAVAVHPPITSIESGNSSASLDSAFGTVTEPTVATSETSEYNAKNHVGSVSMWKKGFRQGIRGSSSAGAAPQGGMALPGMHADVLEDVFSTNTIARPKPPVEGASAPAGFDAFSTTTTMTSKPPPPPPPTVPVSPSPSLTFASESSASRETKPAPSPAVVPTPPRQSKTYVSPSFPPPAAKPAPPLPSQQAFSFLPSPATPIVSATAAISAQSPTFSQQPTPPAAKPATQVATPISSEKKATVKDEKEFHGLVDFDNMMISRQEPAHPSTTEPAKSLNELAKLKAKAQAQAAPTTVQQAAAFAPPPQQVFVPQPGMMMMPAQPYAQPYPVQQPGMQPGMMMMMAPTQQPYPAQQPGMVPYGAAPTPPQYAAYPPPPHQYPPQQRM